jgi:hypothetical protein
MSSQDDGSEDDDSNFATALKPNPAHKQSKTILRMFKWTLTLKVYGELISYSYIFEQEQCGSRFEPFLSFTVVGILNNRYSENTFMSHAQRTFEP